MYTINERKYYKELGIIPGVSLKEIKTAYRKMVKKFHPDTTGKINDRRFIKIVKAYETILSRKKGNNIIFSKVKSYNSHYFNDVFAFGKLLLYNSSTKLRKMAADRLGGLKKKSAYVFLKQGLYDKNSSVVKSVINAIGNLSVRQAAGDLGSVFLNSNLEIKLTILDTLKNIGVNGNYNNIIDVALNDTHYEVRKKASTFVK